MSIKPAFIGILLALAASGLCHAQHSPRELGEQTFYLFKTNNLDSFYSLKATFEELAAFAVSMEIDSTAESFQEFKLMYPSVIEHFKKLCTTLRNDTARLNLSWADARLEEVKEDQMQIPLDDRDPGAKTLSITTLAIHFTSREQQFVLKLGDVAKYGDSWKPGSQIELIKVEPKR